MAVMAEQLSQEPSDDDWTVDLSPLRSTGLGSAMDDRVEALRAQAQA